MAYNSTQQRRIAARLCLVCAQPLADNSRILLCLPCADRRSKQQAKRTQLRRNRVLCVGCGAPREPGHLRCSTCLEQNRSYQDTLRRRRLAQGGCAQCGTSPVLPSLALNAEYRLCEVCYLKKLSRQRLGSNQHWMALREKLAAQEWRCAYTGTLLVLGVNDALDHVLPASRYLDLASDPGNVEWVTRQINEMKRDRTPDEFLCLLRDILAYRSAQ